MADGWISLHRKIEECWLWLDEPFSKGQAWVDLLLMANHHDKQISFNGEIITVSAGSRITSILYLSERWQWSRHKVSNFLNLLEKDKMIIQKRDNKKTLITIVNYELYQSQGEEKDIKRTSKGHQKDTNNNDNKDNNNKYLSDRSDELSNSFEVLYQKYRSLNKSSNGKGKAKQKYIKWCTSGVKVNGKTVKLTPDDIQLGVRTYMQERIEKQKMGGFVPEYKNIDTLMNQIYDFYERGKEKCQQMNNK